MQWLWLSPLANHQLVTDAPSPHHCLSQHLGHWSQLPLAKETSKPDIYVLSSARLTLIFNTSITDLHLMSPLPVVCHNTLVKRGVDPYHHCVGSPWGEEHSPKSPRIHAPVTIHNYNHYYNNYYVHTWNLCILPADMVMSHARLTLIFNTSITDLDLMSPLPVVREREREVASSLMDWKTEDLQIVVTIFLSVSLLCYLNWQKHMHMMSTACCS